VERQRPAAGIEAALPASQIERAVRVMDEQRATFGVDQQLHGDTAAVRAQLIAALSTARGDRRSAAIELWTAFAETEQRAADWKSQRAALRIERQTERLQVDRRPRPRAFQQRSVAANVALPARHDGDARRD